ncbi:MAG: patatin-like phospholipase family protein [Saprospiraceae bacterium]|nr:patatin-like phospholipase family protein [Saprospiraceae bacterium]MCB9326257.1 patatin-like phospholipase family protein [Lewinellaceae bacterium]
MKKIGLVLSGGGVRGMAHIGLLQALEENDIEISAISGASAGALVGTLYAAGMSPQDILKFYEEHSLFNFSYYNIGGIGIFNSSKYQDYYKDYIPENSFEALKKKLFISTTDLEEGKSVIHSSGELLLPLVASASLPPIFSPVEINDKLHADGGILNNFPVEPLTDICDKIIGSYVSPIKPLGKKDLKTTTQISTRSMSLVLYAAVRQKYHLCDVVLEIENLDTVNLLSQRQIKEAYEIGYEKAIKDMALILERLAH